MTAVAETQSSLATRAKDKIRSYLYRKEKRFKPLLVLGLVGISVLGLTAVSYQNVEASDRSAPIFDTCGPGREGWHPEEGAWCGTACFGSYTFTQEGNCGLPLGWDHYSNIAPWNEGVPPPRRQPSPRPSIQPQPPKITGVLPQVDVADGKLKLVVSAQSGQDGGSLTQVLSGRCGDEKKATSIQVAGMSAEAKYDFVFDQGDNCFFAAVDDSTKRQSAIIYVHYPYTLTIGIENAPVLNNQTGRIDVSGRITNTLAIPSANGAPPVIINPPITNALAGNCDKEPWHEAALSIDPGGHFSASVEPNVGMNSCVAVGVQNVQGTWARTSVEQEIPYVLSIGTVKQVSDPADTRRTWLLANPPPYIYPQGEFAGKQPQWKKLGAEADVTCVTHEGGVTINDEVYTFAVECSLPSDVKDAAVTGIITDARGNTTRIHKVIDRPDSPPLGEAVPYWSLVGGAVIASILAAGATARYAVKSVTGEEQYRTEMSRGNLEGARRALTELPTMNPHRRSGMKAIDSLVQVDKSLKKTRPDLNNKDHQSIFLTLPEDMSEEEKKDLFTHIVRQQMLDTVLAQLNTVYHYPGRLDSLVLYARENIYQTWQQLFIDELTYLNLHYSPEGAQRIAPCVRRVVQYVQGGSGNWLGKRVTKELGIELRKFTRKYHYEI